MPYYLEFEKPIAELERQIGELRGVSNSQGIDLSRDIERLDRKLTEKRKDIYGKLTPWQRTLIARHPERPYTLDYIDKMMEGFHELHGDRKFADDPAIVAGLATLDGISVAVIGHQKGRDTKERIYRNFGQAHPDGYRKAIRVMRLAEKFGLPIITFIDTPGAFPGITAEERGQAEAIARNLYEMALLKTPILALVIGEGGSGGALALGVGDRVFMLEYSVYSVISPEGCAAILWKKEKNDLKQEDYAKAAEVLRLTSGDLKQLGVVDEIIKEPLGGMHKAEDSMFQTMKALLKASLDELASIPIDELLTRRYNKIRAIGAVD